MVSRPKFTKLFSLNAAGNAGFQILDISVHSGDIRAQSGKVSKIVPNLACFCPPNFFFFGGGQTPKFLDQHLQIEHAFKHVAKFHGDWPMDLRDLVLKKETAVKHKAFGNYRSGRPKKACLVWPSSKLPK